jgi:hypothetical protein
MKKYIILLLLYVFTASVNAMNAWPFFGEVKQQNPVSNL